MKRFCSKTSVQTIFITTVVTLGLALNHSLKDDDRSEYNVIDELNSDETTRKNATDCSKIDCLTRGISITVTSFKSLLDNKNNTTIIGLVLVGTVLTGFFTGLIIGLKRRQT